MIEVEVQQVRDLETQEEVEKWAQRHGYGLGEIADFVAAWKALKADEAKKKPVNKVVTSSVKK